MASTSAATAPIPGKPLLETRHKGLLTFAIMLAMMMQILDTTIANVALPHMQTSLGARIDTIAWVLTSYILASAVAMPLTGWLAERIGSRNLFLAAVAFFIITSMLCGIATSLEQMVFFRVLQGICAAFIGPLSQTAMLDINAPEDHGRAMSIWSAGAVFGPIIGPLIGGYLTEYYNWRWVFFVNLPLGVFTFTMLFLLLPGRPQQRRGFDLFGFGFLALGVAALQLLLDRGQQLDWWDSWEIRIWAGLAVIGLWVFVIHMITGKTTIISRGIFQNRNFVGAMIFIFGMGAVVFASMALIALMLQGLFEYPVIDTGLVLAPRGLSVLVAMIVAGRLVNRLDARWLLALSFLLCAWSFWLMTNWTQEVSRWEVIWTGLIQGAGIGFVFVLLNTIAFTTLPQELRTEASAMLNLMRSLGASFGISIGASNIARNLQVNHAELSEYITPHRLPALGLDRLQGMGLTDETRLALVDAMINREALMIAYVDDYVLLAAVSAAMVPLAFLLKKLPDFSALAQRSPQAAE